MPYIGKPRRLEIDAEMHAFANVHDWSAGDVAYAVYRIMRENTRRCGFTGMAMTVGAVVLTVARFVLKVVMPYEDAKEAENGGIE